MSRNSLIPVLGFLVVSGILSVAASAVALAPDALYDVCVNPSDRTEFRAERNNCDDLATTNSEYNAGILHPFRCNENTEECQIFECLDGEARYTCSGTPGTPDGEK